MDGRIIQEASRRAIEIGATPANIINDLVKVDIAVPLVVMTYYNPVQHFGHDRFAVSLTNQRHRRGHHPRPAPRRADRAAGGRRAAVGRRRRRGGGGDRPAGGPHHPGGPVGGHL